jgi:hypothetical protein
VSMPLYSRSSSVADAILGPVSSTMNLTILDGAPGHHTRRMGFSERDNSRSTCYVPFHKQPCSNDFRYRASNMNYCLDFSIRVEDELSRLLTQRQVERLERDNEDDITIEEENELYDIAMKKVIESDQGRTLAAGNVRLGELILLVDCDTRVVSFLYISNENCY